MSVKSSARIKKRRSAEAASFAAVSASGSQRIATSGSNSNHQSAAGTSSSQSTSGGNVGSSSAALKKNGPVGRNPNFDTDETKLLIQLWGDPKLQRTLITTHKKHAVICQLAAKMQEYGYHRSPEEITTRIKNLKCFYNRLKKDMECGLAGEAEPTWKHFAEMDAIMTRPIFSVRPNEVPAPSLKYQLEQALEEHAERRKRRLENGDELSDSDNEEDDMLLSTLVPKTNGKAVPPVASKANNDGCLLPDVEVDMDISEETFAAITNAATAEKRTTSKRRKLSSAVGSDVDVDESSPTATTTTSRIKTEPSNQKEQPIAEKSTGSGTAISVSNAGAPGKSSEVTEDDDDDCMVLTLPKEEPIDVDAVDEAAEKAAVTSPSSVRTIMPTLADMLQLPKNANLLPFSGANVIIPASSITTSTNAMSSNTVTVSSTATCQGQGKLAAGKISLVPTNFLMQPKLAPAVSNPNVATNATKTPQLQLFQSAINQGARLMISGGAAAPTQAANAGIVAPGANALKVFLVNADQAAAAKAAVGKSAAALPLAATSLQQPQPQPHQQPQQGHQTLQHQQHQPLQQQDKKDEKRRALEKAREEQQSKRHMTTMRILLRQLLNAQNEANEIQHNRLSLERERLDWEKSMGERLFTVLPTLFQASSVPSTNVAPAHAPSPQFIVSAPSGQRLQPPKLLFTTALPMTNGTVSMPHIITPTSALTASLPKVIAAPAPNNNNTNNNNNGSGGLGKPVEICTQVNDVQLVTPKLEKDG